MKRNLILIVIALLSAAVAIPAGAQTTRDSVKVAVGRALVSDPFFGRKMERATYLGIAATPASPAMREQLKLKPGIGLVVERVEKQSPAELAGVKKYDVLQKIDDQLLVSAEQLAVLVRMRDPGSDATLSLIRQGQPMTVTIKLIEKEVPVTMGLNANEVFINDGAWNGVAISNGRMTLNKTGGGAITLDGSRARIVSKANDAVLTLTREGGVTHLNATDASGNLLFDGPIDTEEQWKGVPQELVGRVKMLLSGVKMNTPATKPAAE
jgi:membrane-associated protease RseP (regulator of RpoE activity)